MSHPTSTTRRPRVFARTLAWLTVVLLAWPAATAEAQTTRTWSGATNATWTTTTNWSGAAIPGSTDTVRFDSTSSNLTTTLGSNFSINGLQVVAPTGLVTINGANSLTIGAGGVDMSSATQDLTVLTSAGNITINSGTFNIASGRTLSLGVSAGSLPVVFNSGTTTLTGGGRLSITNQSGKIVSGAALVVKSGTFQTLTNFSLATGSLLSNEGGVMSLNSTYVSGTFSQSAGSVSSNDFKTTGVNLISGGTASFAFGVNSFTSAGSLAVSGGQVTITQWSLFASSAGANTSVLLSGGTTQMVALPTTRGSNSTSTFTFDGGVLKAGATSTTFLQNLTNAYVTNNGALINTNGNSITIGQTLTNGTAAGTNGLLKKLGSGTLTLSASNSYTGVTQINAGTLNLGSVDALAGSTLDMNSGDAGSLVFGVTGTNTYNLGGLIGPRNLATSGSANLSVGANATSGTYSGILSGAGALTKVGSGTLTLAGANTYGGATTVSGGVLALGASNVLSGSTAVTISGGVLDTTASNYSDTVGAFTISSGTLAGGGTITTGTYALSGGVVNANLGSGTVNVSGNAALNGTVGATTLNLNSGALTLGSGSRFTSAAIAVTGSSGGGVALGGNESFGSLAGSANVALGSGTLSVGGANTSTTYSGIISGSGGLTKTGNGELTLSAANTYTGATTISSGTIIASVANAISGSSAITIGSAGSRGFLKIDDALTISSLTFTGSGGDIIDPSDGLVTFSAPSGTATITVQSGSNKFHANATLASPTLVNVSDGAYFSFHNNLAGGSSLTKSGSGTMNLTGDNDTLSGNLFITGGLVTIGPGMNQIGSGTTTLSNGSTIDLNGRSFTNQIVVLNGTILNAGGTATTTTIAGLSTIGGTTAQGTYNITSTGSALFNVAIGNGASAVDVNVNSGGGQASFAQAVGANGNVTVYGGGTATFDGTVAGYVIAHGVSTFNANVLSGAEVQVNSGTAGTGSALFAAGVASTVTVQSGAAAEFRGAVSGPTTVSGSALFTSASSLTGSLTTNAGGVATFDNVSADITGSIQANGLVTVNRASGSQTISGVISGTGSFTKQAAGTLVLTNANTLTGITTIAGGTLSVGNGGTSGGLAGNVVNNAALIFNRSDNTTYGGNISGSGGLTKLGAGQLTLTGSSSYLGTTTVSSGTLAINGQIAGSAAVTGGATLGGSGVIGGVLSGAGLVSPGNSPGILTASQFDPLGGLDASFELTALSPVYNAPTASVNDILRLTSGTPFTTALGGGNVIDFYFNMNSVGEGTYEAGFFTTLSAADLLSALQSATVNYWIKDSSGGQVFNGIKYSPYSGMTLSTATVTRNFGDGNVTGSVTQFIIVPEPEAIVLAGIGAAVAAWASRRRRR